MCTVEARARADAGLTGARAGPSQCKHRICVRARARVSTGSVETGPCGPKRRCCRVRCCRVRVVALHVLLPCALLPCTRCCRTCRCRCRARCRVRAASVRAAAVRALLPCTLLLPCKRCCRAVHVLLPCACTCRAAARAGQDVGRWRGPPSDGRVMVRTGQRRHSRQHSRQQDTEKAKSRCMVVTRLILSCTGSGNPSKSVRVCPSLSESVQVCASLSESLLLSNSF